MRVALRLFAFAGAVAASAVLQAPAVAQDSDNFHVVKAIPFPPTAFQTPANSGKVTSFDISYVDPKLGLYVLGDRSSNAIDLIHVHNNHISQLAVGAFKGVATTCASGNVNDCSGPDGVLIVENREVWVGDGDSTVKIVNIAHNTIVDTLSTGGKFRVDEMCLDPRHEIVMVTNNADDPPFSTFFSTDGARQKLGTISFTNSTNGAEQCVWSPRTGKFYIAIPETNRVTPREGAVAVIDPKNLGTVEKFFDIPLAGCKNPQGMAVGPDHQILLGCNGASGDGLNSTVVIDERDGHVIKTFNQESGSDMVWFNPGNGHYFLARSSAAGTTQRLGIIDAEGLTADTDIVVGAAGAPNAHSVAADPVTNKTFFPVPAGKNLCSQAPGAPAGIDAVGCIAVIKGKNDRDDCVAEGAPVIAVTHDGDSRFHKGECRDRDDDHDHDRD